MHGHWWRMRNSRLWRMCKGKKSFQLLSSFKYAIAYGYARLQTPVSQVCLLRLVICSTLTDSATMGDLDALFPFLLQIFEIHRRGGGRGECNL